MENQLDNCLWSLPISNKISTEQNPPFYLFYKDYHCSWKHIFGTSYFLSIHTKIVNFKFSYISLPELKPKYSYLRNACFKEQCLLSFMDLQQSQLVFIRNNDSKFNQVKRGISESCWLYSNYVQNLLYISGPNLVLSHLW